MDRRKFLSAAALLAVAPALNSKSEKKIWIPEFSGFDEEQYWKEIRALFPLEAGKVYLNNGTMGLTSIPVLQTLEKSFLHASATGSYPSHNENLQKSIGDIIGAQAHQIAITKNVSEGTNHACWGIKMKRKDEVIMTIHEHVGGCLPWINRAKKDGIVIRTVELGKTADETLKIIEAAITKRTRVIAVPHIPCTIGQILPVKEICSLARSKGIVSAIDGAHPLGMIQFNVKEMGCDYYYGCIHKWALGPLGVGFFYASDNALSETNCTHVAAYSSDSFSMITKPPQMGEFVKGAQRFSYGTFCGPLWDGAEKALELYRTIGPEKIENRGKYLAKYLQEKVMEFEGKTEMVTPTEAISRGCQIGFRIKNGNPKANSEFVNKCREIGIILRHVGESNIDCIRVSTHYYNNNNEIDMFANELKKYIG